MRNKTEKNNILGMYNRDVCNIKLLTYEEELALLKAAKAGDTVARDRLVEANLRFVIKVAKRYSKATGLPMLDLINEGNIGLLEAVNKFKVEKKVRFLTYAIWWITQKIKLYIATMLYGFRVEPRVANIISKIKSQQHSMDTDRIPPEVMEKLFPVKEGQTQKERNRFRNDLKRAEVATAVMLRTGDSLYPDTDLTVGDVLTDNSPANLDNVIIFERNQKIWNILAALPERERRVICMRFGFNKMQKCYTLQEIANECGGISRERIRQIEASTLRKLTNLFTTNNLKQYA